MNLNQVTVPSGDLSVSIPFYQELGLKLIVHTHERYARFECPNGEATFSLHLVDEMASGSGTVVYFECDDLDARVDQLVRQGVQFDLMPTDQRWLWREAHLKDPFGNALILFHGGENRKNPPWRLNP